jgi:hypothetical protein
MSPAKATALPPPVKSPGAVAPRRLVPPGAVVLGLRCPRFTIANTARREGQGMKIKEIAEAMSGNTVWCRNSWFAPSATPCAEVAGCAFKDCQVRLATPRELYKCRMFKITTVSSS